MMMKKGYQEMETEIKKKKRGRIKKRKRRRFSPWLNKLPQEILFDIFSRLPVESLLRCKRLLKSWNTLISDPQFINTHLLHASSSQVPDILVLTPSSKKLFRVSHVGSGYESVKSLSLPKDFSPFVVNSCNGLLAFRKHYHEHLFVDIWNPYTKKRTKCPSVVSSPPCGFGYDPIFNEYKLVALFQTSSLAKYEAVVYTIGSTSWRHIKEVPFKPIWIMKSNAVHLNGTVYWFASAHQSKKGFVSFGIRDEKFGFIDCPPQAAVSYACGEDLNLSVLGGYLCLVDYSSHDNVVVWALKKHSGGDELWTKQFVLTIPERIHSMQLLHTFNNGEILLRMVQENQNKCVYYDPKENQYRDNETLTALLSSENFTSTFVHVGSLVSPSLTE